MSFPRYPSYKSSGVEWLGDVPAHWEVRRLKHLLHQPVTDGPHTTPEFLSDGVPFLSVDAIQRGELDFATCRFISTDDHAEFRKKASPRRDDILMGKAASTGKIARVKVDAEFSIWSPLALIRVKSGVSAGYCEYVLKSQHCQSQIDVLCTSNTQKNISMGDIPTLLLALPPLSEQRAIAAFLDRETAKIDALVAEQERLIQLLKEKRQAVISHAVTKGLDLKAPMKPSGVEWLGDVPAHWEASPLRSLARPGANSFTDGDWIEAPFITDEGVRLLQTGNIGVGTFKEQGFRFISEQSFNNLGCTEVDPGDVLICRLAEPVGRACLAPSLNVRMITSVDVCILKTSAHECPRFLVHLMSSAHYLGFMEGQCRGGTRDRVSRSFLAGVRLLLPPLPEQRAISAFLDRETAKIDGLVAEAESAITLLQERRSALISAAVTGQIDVRNAVATEAA